MSYQRKQQEKHHYEKLSHMEPGYPNPVYWDEDRGYWRRQWKSEGRRSNWAYLKKLARRKIRRHFKETGIYTSKVYDPMWEAW